MTTVCQNRSGQAKLPAKHPLRLELHIQLADRRNDLQLHPRLLGDRRRYQ